MPEQSVERMAELEKAREVDSKDEGSAGEPAQKNHPEKPRKHPQPPIWEWIVAFVGLALVMSAIGFMLYRAIKGNSSPPQIAVSVDSVLPTDNGFLVTFRVVNRGEITAAGLSVEGELRTGAENVETSTATLNYVPSRSERRGGLFFTNDPQKFELKVRAKGYERP